MKTEYKTIQIDGKADEFNEKLNNAIKEGWKPESIAIVEVSDDEGKNDRWCAILSRKLPIEDVFQEAINELYTSLCDRIPYAEEPDDLVENALKYIYKLENEKKLILSEKPIGANKYALQLLKEKEILKNKVDEVLDLFGEYVCNDLYSWDYGMEQLKDKLKEAISGRKSISKHQTFELVHELCSREGVDECVVDDPDTSVTISSKNKHGESQKGVTGPARILIVTD